jgi:hypothetical protein
VENTGSVTQKPIEIYVSAPWSKRGESTVPMRQDQTMGISEKSDKEGD